MNYISIKRMPQDGSLNQHKTKILGKRNSKEIFSRISEQGFEFLQ